MYGFPNKKIVGKRKQHLVENLKFLSLLHFISAFEEESNRKLITLVSADCFIENSNVYDFRVEMFVMPEVFDFKKPCSILMEFQLHSCGTLSKGICIKKADAGRNGSAFNII